MTTLTVQELARRICIAAHRSFPTSTGPVPCGQHVTDARRYWSLVSTPEGAEILRVLEEARVATT
jgi:hypothetical protein